MKMITAVAVLLAGGIHIFSYERPTELPIGNREKVVATLARGVHDVALYVWSEKYGSIERLHVGDGEDIQDEDGVWRPGVYDPDSMGTPQEVAHRKLPTLLETLKDDRYVGEKIWITFQVTRGVPFKTPDGLGSGHHGLILVREWISFTPERNGAGVVEFGPEVTNFPMDVNVLYAWLPIPWEGVRWVEFAVYGADGNPMPVYYDFSTGEPVYRELTRNGAPEWCEFSKMFGVDPALYLRAEDMAGLDGSFDGRFGWARGEVILYYDDGRREYDRFDVLTGKLIERVNPFAVAIARTPDGGVEVTVKGIASARVLLEESEDLAVWKTSATIAGKAGEPQRFQVATDGKRRFYRARAVPAQ